MRKILACVLAMVLILSLGGISVMAETDYSGLIEECLTTEVKTAISKNLTMISSWNDTPITWESSNPAVISADGTVTRGVADKTVTLTAMEDGNPVKTLTYTVLSKYKTVWYNENFYRPSYDGRELVGSTELAASTKDIEYSSKSGAKRIGFYKAAGKGDSTSAATTSLQVKANPLNASDYALCSTDGTAQKGFYLAFPEDKPSGKVTVQADLCTTGVDKQDKSNYDMHTYIGFNSAASTSVANLQWLAADGFQIRNSANPVQTPVSQLASAGATTVSTTLKMEIDFDEKTLKIIDSSVGKLVDDNSATFTADATLQSIWFYARTGSGAVANSDLSFWLDNVVITTEEHIVDGVTVADGILSSVTTNSDSEAKGYIAVYNNSDMILDVKTFDIAEGTAIANNLEYNLPQDYSYCRIFVLDDNIVPLDTVYSNKQ